MTNIFLLIGLMTALIIVYIVALVKRRRDQYKRRQAERQALTRAKVQQQADKDLIERFKQSQFVAAPYVPKPKRVTKPANPLTEKFWLRIKRGKKIFHIKCYYHYQFNNVRSTAYANEQL